MGTIDQSTREDRLIVRFDGEARYPELRAVGPTGHGYRAVCGVAGPVAYVIDVRAVPTHQWLPCRECRSALGRPATARAS